MVCGCQIRFGENGIVECNTTKVAMLKNGFGKITFGKVGLGELYIFKTCLFYFGFIERGVGKVAVFEAK